MSQRKVRVSRVASLLIEDDPFRPPPPLVECVEGQRGGRYNFREGGRMMLSGRDVYSPEALFNLTLIGSAILDGQPIRCSGIVPGVSMRMMVRFHPRAHEIKPEHYAQQVWRCVRPIFDDWLVEPKRVPGFTMEIEGGGVTVRFARDELLQLRPGVMQIEVRD